MARSSGSPSRASSPNARRPVREGGNRLCFVRDPDGYRIELIEA
jgi:catechol 2,3-dioxygenase-like lactoylglutathione lyase family enzyme